MTPGALFCCVRGQRTDGHDLAPAALDAGAAALLVDHPLTLPAPHAGAPQVQVPDVRAALGRVSAAFWGRPSEHMYVVGVTGTAGKTTVTHLVQAVLDVAGLPCGLIGTISGARTTPEAPELQALLAQEAAAGRKAVAVEVSSHGLELHRVDATRFAVAVFTNLSHEHLDFHHTMDAYFAAKARLFTPAFTERAVVCTDDAWGRRLADDLAATPGAPRVTPYGLDEVSDLRQRPGGSLVHLAGRARRAAAPRPVQRPQRPGRGPRRRSPSASPSPPWPRACRRRRRCRAASSRSTPASPSPCSSTTPTSPRPSARPWPPPASW